MKRPNLDFNKPCNIHFIGIGGISMSGLAKLLVSKGFRVSGSDGKPSELTKELEDLGCVIHYPQAASNISDDLDMVVYTAAIHEDNPELMEARKKVAHVIPRADLLGSVMANYPTAINIAGTHGKTTTSSMISEITMGAGLDPTISLGGILDSIGGNFRIGHSDVFVCEACEYTNSFLSFAPTINVILNVQEDHLDFFKDLADIRHSFKKFVELLPEDGALVINSDIEDIAYFTKDAACKKVITVGSNPDCSDYSATEITYNSVGCPSYTLLKKGVPSGRIQLSVPGLHNVYNSLAAIAVGDLLSVSMEQMCASLLNYKGTKRRFEYKGMLEPNHATVIDDYAHHPAEIEATLKGAKNYPHNRLIVIFQPHTYTRTKAFLKDFAKALSHADLVILADIYAARETDTLGISSKTLQEEILALGASCEYFDSFEKIESYVRKIAMNNDLLITMGAGNVVEVGEHLV
ncbi:MAG: UDP-N-acetylmuramate--L-alanine ligase [Lachnospiraceae bacterium]|nr:UDP-N-acetylmuramate--L-alanine ligase [Lachnospiraceae bacterium]